MLKNLKRYKIFLYRFFIVKTIILLEKIEGLAHLLSVVKALYIYKLQIDHPEIYTTNTTGYENVDSCYYECCQPMLEPDDYEMS